MSPVSKALRSRRPGLFFGCQQPSVGLGTLTGDSDIQAPAHSDTQSFREVGRPHLFLEPSVSFRLLSAVCHWDLGGGLCVCLSVCPFGLALCPCSWLLRPGLHGLTVTTLLSLDQKCNPHLTSIGNGTVQIGAEGYATQWWDAPSIVGLIIFILCTFFIRYGGGLVSGEGS